MSEMLEKLYSGNFNSMNVEEQSDGSVIIALSKRGEGKIYRFQVNDLYGDNEEVLWEEVIERS